MKLPFSLLLLTCLLLDRQADAQVDLQNTGILYSSNSSDILYINGNFVNTSAASLTNNGSLHVKQNLTNDQAFGTIGTGTLYLNGSTAQTVNGSQTFKTYNLNTNNTAGILLNNNLSVTGTHTFANGLITTSATPNYLIYEAGSSYTGDNDSRHVNGWVKKFGTTAFTFPVGDATWERTIAITGLSATSEFNAKYYTVTPNATQVLTPLISTDPSEYWALNKVSGGSASVAMNWDNSKVSFPNWILSSIVVANYNGSLWTNQGQTGGATGNVTTTGAITSNSISSFNLFTFGSTAFTVPLTLISFTAKPEGEHIRLDWKTENESNINHFSIERSIDGVNFYQVASVDGRNSGNSEVYSINDNAPVSNAIYYRLRTIDMDGRYKLSSVVVIRNDDRNDQLLLVTNPVHDQVILQAGPQLKGIFDYTITQLNGQFLSKGRLTIEEGKQNHLVLPGTINSGAYILTVSNTQKMFSFKIIKM